MFDLPNAKRVRREDILSRASSASRSPSPQPEPANTDAHQRLAKLLNLDTFVATTTQPEASGQEPHPDEADGPNKAEEEEQEFEFRLFSAPAATKSQSQTQATGDSKDSNENTAQGAQKLRIRLRSPTPETGDGRFVNPFRGWGYYFSTPTLSGVKVDEDPQLEVRKKQFADVAVSGDDLLGWAKISWPGCHLPWRVIRLNRQHTKLPRESNDTIIAYNAESEPQTPKSYKKPGKKRRLQLRKRVKAAEQAKETEAEKRNRKNRERKIKRRQKAREIKAATAAATGQALPVEMDEDVSSQEEDN
ncbi:hypothetical protein P170DRAFT_505919 [Aspergillus steynii IBT 23096]|uniref:Uncharacterized protein n=1 Tax=Aspergillus steynii IBT 23096 TaxID=1392250 RepID=A0A2I2GR05_9EURO|nr:uncharacterized protein P170DRAFT_505919 [Aspergillus steynii IBT 23096]PLB55315.1 hypothetical protein P170DRAFT_505919 [Aspergillus steynii IBT 23096]